MAHDEQLLLENALDALDRLFDRQCGVVDVWALLVASAHALQHTPHHQVLSQPLTALKAIIRSGAADDDQLAQALEVTDPLRLYLAECYREMCE
jgi:hypothetical protein